MTDKDLVYKVIGAAMEVYRNLGYGLLESIYQEAMAVELQEKGIAYALEMDVPVFYKGLKLKKTFRLDMLIDDKVVVELKSVSKLGAEHRIQLCNYLRLTHKPIGLLINFGTSPIIGERWMYNEEYNECYLIDKDMKPVHLYNEDDN